MLAKMHLAAQDFPLYQPNLRGLAWWLEALPLVLPFLGVAWLRRTGRGVPVEAPARQAPGR